MSNHSQSVATAPISEIRGLLERSQRVLVASHIDPDGDAIGTQLAFGGYLKALGKEAFLVRDAEVPVKYRFLDGADAIRHVSEHRDDLSIDTALILECPNADRIGEAGRFLTTDIQVINIDHHRDNRNFGTVNWVDPSASSVGEMACEYFREVGFQITPAIAEQLYTAILTDTGRFRFSSTTARTLAVAGELIAAGANPQKICDHAYYNLQPSTMRLIGKVLNSIEFFDDGTICFLTLTRAMLAQTGAELSESEGLVDFTMFTNGVLAGALLKENSSGVTKVSLRSRNLIDVAQLAAQFGGGGHPNAAGCTIPLPLGQAREQLLQIIREVHNGSRN
ncbi:MAG: bifunctional oligoribonuclease/PAP phosphatase NrnA [Candidatus Zixiibacteriota bacterium]